MFGLRPRLVLGLLLALGSLLASSWLLNLWPELPAGASIGFAASSECRERGDQTDHRLTPNLNFSQVARLLHMYGSAWEHNTTRRLSNAGLSFRTMLSFEERLVFYELVRLLDRILTDNQVPYFLWAGSLIGSYRHHDFQPWDEDIDICLDIKHRPVVAKLLSGLAPKYVYLRVRDGQDKLFRRDGRVIRPRLSWRYPFIDLAYFQSNSTHYWMLFDPYKRRAFYRLDRLQPYKRRPFADMWLLTPADSFAVLVELYGANNPCVFGGYSHILEAGNPLFRQQRINCSLLKNVYPFVHRQPLTALRSGKPAIGLTEVLMLGDTVLNRVDVDEPSYAVTEPFWLRVVSSSVTGGG